MESLLKTRSYLATLRATIFTTISSCFSLHTGLYYYFSYVDIRKAVHVKDKE